MAWFQSIFSPILVCKWEPSFLDMFCIGHNWSEFSFKTLNWSNFERFNSALNYGLKLQFLNLNIISKPGLNSDFFRKSSKFDRIQNS